MSLIVDTCVRVGMYRTKAIVAAAHTRRIAQCPADPQCTFTGIAS
jgi:hypothetical protein